MARKFEGIKVGDEVALTGVEVRGTVTDVQGTSLEIGNEWYSDNRWNAEVIVPADNPGNDAVGTVRQHSNSTLFIKTAGDRWIGLNTGSTYVNGDLVDTEVVRVVVIEKAESTPTTYSATDREPPREGQYSDVDGDTWAWDGGWFWAFAGGGRANDERDAWAAVVSHYPSIFPLTRIEG